MKRLNPEKKRRVAVVTGSRAEYSLLKPVMKELRASRSLELYLMVTGMQLAPEFGSTYRCIEDDGFKIDARVDMLLAGDSPWATAKSMGLGTIGFADAFRQAAPDLVMLLGDRFELLAAAQVALVARIPIVHLCGGDTTEGAFDEAIRHSITKMSHFHFVTNAESGARVRQLGENPAHVYVVGSPGIDNILHTPRLSRKELEARLKFKLRKRNCLVTFHPVTLSRHSSADQARELLTALDALGDEFGLLFTMPNADPQGRELIALFETFVAAHPNACMHPNLGAQVYYSAIENVDVVVGNSSSGLYEVPTFRKPTVNIGDRQKGRLRGVSVIDCAARSGEISRAIRAALAKDCSKAVNPYGSGQSARRIVRTLEKITDFRSVLQKPFYGVSSGSGRRKY